MHASDTLGAAMRIVEDAWEELRRSPFVQKQLGMAFVQWPDLSQEEAQRRSTIGKSLLERIAALPEESLPHSLALTLRLVRFRASTWAREGDWYWRVVDPVGMGFFGMFLPTAYCGGMLLNFVHTELAAIPLEQPRDTDRYLGLISDYARLLEQFASRTAGQAARGMRMPKPQIHQARTLLTGLREQMRTVVGAALARCPGPFARNFSVELERRVATRVEPAFERVLAELGDEYLAQAPEAVGLGQYPQGASLYAELVKLHTTLDLTPEQIHARGLQRMQQIERDMQAIRADRGFGTDAAAFAEKVNGDPRWRAHTADAVKSVFHRYLDRFMPHLNECFALPSAIPCGVTPLPEALQSAMTFGYYDPPRPDRVDGQYFFNAANLTRRALIEIGSLTYHELLPGHHLHLTTQQSNPDLPRFRAHSFVNAYNEGWAEYAATLAGEIGLYEEPEERYGRLLMDAFLTCRLVVDTGMNCLGWSLERAREYLRTHGGVAETEIFTESLRYSCDIPGQSLAYKLGDTEILAMRERMRRALGARFNLKKFHAAVLGPGALPLPDLAWHVEHEIEQLLAAS